MQKPVFVFRGARVFLIGNGIKKGAVLHTARQEKACRFGISEDQPATVSVQANAYCSYHAVDSFQSVCM